MIRRRGVQEIEFRLNDGHHDILVDGVPLLDLVRAAELPYARDWGLSTALGPFVFDRRQYEESLRAITPPPRGSCGAANVILPHCGFTT
ncbi:hypothetical protein FAF44_30920 [Nonomuraea sp. MG754425]|uniref:hypothetical protein n=1 Tax=Nonomuraea sp. MG754425 TaxID=2570319 RepID=UPI001F1E907A|nr:hypothetical protein [Nonomuraea sp. MG754425]MCF6472777.1 hypothetical protein [Nonomuraea sp. MG754425]